MKKDQKKIPARSNLILRMAAGAYLLYLDYGIKDSIFEGTGMRQIVFALFGILFLAVGVLLVAASIRRLSAGQYLEAAEAMEENEAGKQAATSSETHHSSDDKRI